MKSFIKNIVALFFLTILISCNSGNERADGYGNLEAVEVTISAEANGKLEFFKLEEGDVLQKKTLVGLIDTIQLYYAKQQLVASKSTVFSRSKNVLSQISVLREQLKTAVIEKKRIENMFAENSATQRQIDDINGKVSVLNEQIKSVETEN